MEVSLTAKYTDGQYVSVDGLQNQERLKDLGDFGVDTDERKKRELIRRGKQDLPIEDVNTLSRQSSDLTLHEAFFLTSALGVLEVLDEDNRKLDISACWEKFRKFNSRNNSPLDFALEYGVYFYFKTRGWVVKSGENYGVDFLLYDQGISSGHSQYAVAIIESDDHVLKTTWKQLLTKHRVVQSVNKKFLAAIVSPCQECLSRQDCVEKMRITVRSFTGNVAIHDL